jgi:hypothetical protein
MKWFWRIWAFVCWALLWWLIGVVIELVLRR